MDTNRWPSGKALAAVIGSSVLLACSQSPTTNTPPDGAGTGGATPGAGGRGGAGAGTSAGAAGAVGSGGSGAATAGTAGLAGGAGSAAGGGGGKASAGADGGRGLAGTAGSSDRLGGTGGTQAGAAGQAGASNSGGSAGLGGSAGTASSQAGAAGTAAMGGGAGGASSCAGLICEDFETGSIDAEKWETSSMGGTLEVQSKQVAHGKYALHLQGLGSGSDDWATLFAKEVPTALKAATAFGRASMYFSAGASASLHIQFPFAGSTGTGSGSGPAPLQKLRYLEVGSYNGQWQLSFDIHDVSPNIEDSAYAGSKIPTEKWVCIEWEFEDAPERITLWVGGTQAGVFDNMHINYSSDGMKSGGTFYQSKTSGLIGVFDTFGIGFHDWHPTKAFDVYYDDVVLDTKRVGCPTQ